MDGSPNKSECILREAGYQFKQKKIDEKGEMLQTHAIREGSRLSSPVSDSVFTVPIGKPVKNNTVQGV
jgi:hypothetical protein